ncbi:MAG: hypothetical protein P8X95_20440 [Anaerolineales bacterium]
MRFRDFQINGPSCGNICNVKSCRRYLTAIMPAVLYEQGLSPIQGEKMLIQVDTTESLRKEISARLAKYDFKNLSADVSPFLVNQADIKRVEKFREFWDQVELD